MRDTDLETFELDVRQQVGRVAGTGEPLRVNADGKPSVVVISHETFESFSRLAALEDDGNQLLGQLESLAGEDGIPARDAFERVARSLGLQPPE